MRPLTVWLLAAACIAAINTKAATGAVTWGACPGVPAVANISCAAFTVPLNWFSAQDGKAVGRNMTLQLMRLLPSIGPGDAAVWFFGEGCSIWSAGDTAAAGWAQLLSRQGFTVYVPDLRGSGLSSKPLVCFDDPYGQQVWPSLACANRLATTEIANDLGYYSLTQAAYDVQAMVTAVSSNFTKNYAAADSFGSLWLQETLGLIPTMPMISVVMSSMMAPNAYDVFGSLASYTSVARQVLEQCQARGVCTAQLGGGTTDPLRFLDADYLGAADLCLSKHVTVSTGTLQGLGINAIQTNLVVALLVGPVDVFSTPVTSLASTIPAFLFRANRCNATVDGPVLNTFVNAVLLNATRQIAAAAPPTPAPQAMKMAMRPGTTRQVCVPSPALRANILFNEFVSNNVATTVAAMARLPVPPPAYTLNMLKALYDAWPLYNAASGTSAVAAAHGYTTADIPTYIIPGALDVVSPMYAMYFATMWYPNQFSVPALNGGHRLIQDPTLSLCVAQQYADFFKGSPPAACGTFVDWQGTDPSTAAMRLAFFGTLDMWQYVRPASSTAPIFPKPTPGTQITITISKKDGVIAGVVIALIVLLFASIVIYCKCRKPADPFAHVRDGVGAPSPTGGVNAAYRQSVGGYSAVSGGGGGISDPYAFSQPPSAAPPTSGYQTQATWR